MVLNKELSDSLRSILGPSSPDTEKTYARLVAEEERRRIMDVLKQRFEFL